MQGMIVDLFAGGGGTSLGIEMALGRSPDVAINHDPQAVAVHAANHPQTRHFCEDVWAVSPIEATGGQHVALLWASPDCTHFSRAKGGKPILRRRRVLAHALIRWAREVRPDMMALENVLELLGWGPVHHLSMPCVVCGAAGDGRPCPARVGRSFRRWVAMLRNLGYVVEWRELVAADYGAPTTRKRLYLIARCDGQEIVWPERTHGPGRLPYRTAAECIEWSLPCPSIFERERPLVEASLRRIARGVKRYVFDTAEPFIVGLGGRQGQSIERPVSRPYQTITTKADSAIVVPSLIQTGYGERAGQDPRVLDLHKPLGTVVAGGTKHALVAAFLAKHYGGHETSGSDVRDPIGTITTQDHHHLVTVPFGGNDHRAEVRALLLSYYGTDQDARLTNPLPTVTTHDRFGIVMVAGQMVEVYDLGMRMLVPRELFRAQGFPDSYRIEVEVDGKILSKATQVRLVGNSVSPPVAEAIIRANVLGVGVAGEARQLDLFGDDTAPLVPFEVRP